MIAKNLPEADVKDLFTVKAAFRLFAERMLSKFANNIPDHQKRSLESLLEADSPRISWTSVDVAHGKYEIHVYMSFDSFLPVDNRVRDRESGDIYRVYEKAKIEVAWPSFGSLPCNVATEVLDLWNQVAAFCMGLSGALDRTTVRLEKTVGEQENDARVRREREVQSDVERIVGAESKHMRVGSERTVMFPGIPAGEYRVGIVHGAGSALPSMRNYTVVVTHGDIKYLGRIIRTS